MTRLQPKALSVNDKKLITLVAEVVKLDNERNRWNLQLFLNNLLDQEKTSCYVKNFSESPSKFISFGQKIFDVIDGSKNDSMQKGKIAEFIGGLFSDYQANFKENLRISFLKGSYQEQNDLAQEAQRVAASQSNISRGAAMAGYSKGGHSEADVNRSLADLRKRAEYAAQAQNKKPLTQNSQQQNSAGEQTKSRATRTWHWLQKKIGLRKRSGAAEISQEQATPSANVSGAKSNSLQLQRNAKY